MIEYAVSLYLDDAANEQLLHLMCVAADACGNDYMLEPKLMPPHITVCYFTTDSIDAAERLVGEEASILKRGDVMWPSLGTFVPSVLFAAPTLNQYLFDVNTNFNARLAGGATLFDYYRPYQWTPHTTLATNLTARQLTSAFSAIAPKYKPIKGTAVALSLASCEPFTDLRIWRLAEDSPR